MDIFNIEVARIDAALATRKRPVSPEKVADIQRSIAQQGLLQPIGVKPVADGFRLVFGAHRLAAFQESGAPEVPALVFPADATDEECLLAEMQENLARNDLTGAERKAFAAEVGRLIPLLSQDSTGDTDSTVEQKWLLELADKSGIGKSAMYNWWRAFTAETNREMTPKQAAAEDKAAFFDWLEDAKRKADEEKAEKERKAEEDRQRKDAEAKQKRMDADRAEIYQVLDAVAKDWGREQVVTWAYQWIESA